MLYLIGGASRSGKSSLAAKLVQRGIPFFSLDAIMLVAEYRSQGKPLSRHDSPERRSEALWPITASMIKATACLHEKYAFEGDYLLPDNVMELRRACPKLPVRAVFLGYAEASVDQKLHEIRAHVSPENWTRFRSDDELRNHLAMHIGFSKTLKERCWKSGLMYVDADNPEQCIRMAYEYLVRGDKERHYD